MWLATLRRVCTSVTAAPVRSRTWVLSLLCSGCMVPVGNLPSHESVPAPPITESRRAAVAAAVVDEANRVRTEQGLQPLMADEALSRAAISHAQELARRRVLTHDSEVAARKTVGMRVTLEGATWQRVGENLASMSGGTVAVPVHTVRLWLDSPGHRANLLHAQFTHTGVGVATDSHGVWYVVQVYSAPRVAR